MSSIYISVVLSHGPNANIEYGRGYKSPKSFLDENKHMHGDRTLKNQPNKMGNTFTPSLYLVAFCQLCFVFLFFFVVICVHRRVVEGSGVGI